ncbi:hypothetical protein [Novosphingobium sp.]|uniref:hypothetical protein n=1 Tax=Novosphingobium sp. TaxID=1874826 RepID=UPI002D1FC1B9|nr:hypothetical protein [Novosphingobium sp.]
MVKQRMPQVNTLLLWNILFSAVTASHPMKQAEFSHFGSVSIRSFIVLDGRSAARFANATFVDLQAKPAGMIRSRGWQTATAIHAN